MKQLKSHMTRRQWDDMLKVLNLFNAHIITPSQLVQCVREVFGQQPELPESFYQFLVMFCGSAAMFNTAGDKGERDLGPSYHLMPAQSSMPLIARDSVANEVLNTEVVTKSSCSCARQPPPHRNAAQQALQQVEDERFELDVLISNISSTVALLDPIMEEIGSLPTELQRSFALGDNLTPLQIRTIERLYGEKEGYMLVNALYESPGAVIPVVLERLHQREKLTKQVREQLDEKWRATSEKHYFGALDVSSAAQKERDLSLFSKEATRLEETVLLEAAGVHHTYQAMDSDAGLLQVVQQVAGSGAEMGAVHMVWKELLAPFLEIGTEGAPTAALGGATGAGEGSGAAAPKTDGDATGECTETKSESQEAGVRSSPGSSKRAYLTPEIVALMQVHQALHCRLVALKKVLSKCSTDQTETLFAKIVSVAKGQLQAEQLVEWCTTSIGPNAYHAFTMDLLLTAFIRRCGTVTASSDWKKVCEGVATASTEAVMLPVLGARCIEVLYDTASLQMNAVCIARRTAVQQAAEASKQREAEARNAQAEQHVAKQAMAPSVMATLASVHHSAGLPPGHGGPVGVPGMGHPMVPISSSINAPVGLHGMSQLASGLGQGPLQGRGPPGGPPGTTPGGGQQRNTLPPMGVPNMHNIPGLPALHTTLPGVVPPPGGVAGTALPPMSIASHSGAPLSAQISVPAGGASQGVPHAGLGGAPGVPGPMGGPVPLAVGQVMVAAPVSSVSPPLPAVLLSQAPAGTEEMRVAEVAARQNLPDRSPRAASGLAPLSMDAAPGPDRLGGVPLSSAAMGVDQSEAGDRSAWPSIVPGPALVPADADMALPRTQEPGAK